MANLPNINTSDIGIIAFWNAHDHRVNGASIDPTDSIPTFSTYTVYDNGIDGKIDPSAKGWGGSDRQIDVRVKNDGWIIAWIDRTNTFDYPDKAAGDFGESGYKGYYDILWDWFKNNVNVSSSYTTLSYMIYKLYDTLSNKAEFTFAAADVGHYCYEFINANVITVLDVQATGYVNKIGNMQYTTGTTIHYIAATGAIIDNAYSKIPLTTLCNGSAVAKYATLDILTENLMPNPLTDYIVRAVGYAGGAKGHTCVLILWS